MPPQRRPSPFIGGMLRKNITITAEENAFLDRHPEINQSALFRQSDREHDARGAGSPYGRRDPEPYAWERRCTAVAPSCSSGPSGRSRKHSAELGLRFREPRPHRIHEGIFGVLRAVSQKPSAPREPSGGWQRRRVGHCQRVAREDVTERPSTTEDEVREMGCVMPPPTPSTTRSRRVCSSPTNRSAKARTKLDGGGAHRPCQSLRRRRGSSSAGP